VSADATVLEAACRDVLAESCPLAAVAIVPLTGSGPPVWLLSPSERRQAAALRVPKRRAEWLAGRVAAKRACLALLDPPLSPAALECARHPGGALRVAVAGATVHDLSVTIAHGGGVAGAVAARQAAAGFDIEPLAPLDPALVRRAFSETERADVAAAPSATERQHRALRLWTAKEAVLKALRVGLRWAPAWVEVELESGCAQVGGALFRVETVVTPSYVAAIALAGG
jgi:phosphopantetheinyl transferase